MELNFAFRTESGTRYLVSDQHVWRDGTWIGLLVAEKSSIRFGESATLGVVVPDGKGSLSATSWSTTRVLSITSIENVTGAPACPVMQSTSKSSALAGTVAAA